MRDVIGHLLSDFFPILDLVWGRKKGCIKIETMSLATCYHIFFQFMIVRMKIKSLTKKKRLKLCSDHGPIVWWTEKNFYRPNLYISFRGEILQPDNKLAPVKIPSPVLRGFWWNRILQFGPFDQPGQLKKYLQFKVILASFNTCCSDFW